MKKFIQLGRFAPFHRGHQMVTESILSKHKPQEIIIMLGSSNITPNPRTPFTIEQRYLMLQTLYPNIDIITIPDIEADRTIQRASTLDLWLESIKAHEKKHNKSFHFYGGSEADLQDLSQAFNVEIIVDRYAEGENISGTKIRDLLKKKQFTKIEPLVPKKILPLIIKFYQENQKKFDI